MLTIIFSALPLIYLKSIYEKDNGQERKTAYAVRDLHVLIIVSLLYERIFIFQLEFSTNFWFILIKNTNHYYVFGPESPHICLPDMPAAVDWMTAPPTVDNM